MSHLLESIAAQLRHFTHEEIVALVRDFLAGLDEKQQIRFLNLVAQGPRPLVAEALGLGDAEDLLDEIQTLHDAIADDELGALEVEEVCDRAGETRYRYGLAIAGLRKSIWHQFQSRI